MCKNTQVAQMQFITWHFIVPARGGGAPVACGCFLAAECASVAGTRGMCECVSVSTYMCCQPYAVLGHFAMGASLLQLIIRAAAIPWAALVPALGAGD